MDERIPLWLDCDPGHDDAFALLLGSFLPWFRLVGVSTVHGNASLENTTTNAISLLTAYDKFDVNVYPGCEMPLVRRVHVATDIHGTSGLDGTALLPSPGFAAQPDHTAVSAMAEAIRINPGTIAIVATGTLTNIAVLVQRYPDLLPKIRVLSIMGGGIKLGNWTEYAEFNIWCDPQAAQIVLQNPVLAPKTVLVPLDLTHQAIATEEIQEMIQKGPRQLQSGGRPQKRSVIRQMLYELLTFFADSYRKSFGFESGPPVHDPLAVVAVLPFYTEIVDHIPDIGFKFTRYNIDVVQSGEQIGRTVPVSEDSNGVIVATEMNMETFWSLVAQAVNVVDAHVSGAVV